MFYSLLFVIFLLTIVLSVLLRFVTFVIFKLFLVLCVMFYSLLFVIFLLTVVLSVLLRFLTFVIFKLSLVSSCCSIFSFLCNVLQLVVCHFSFDHCIVCPSSISDFCYLQTFLSFLCNVLQLVVCHFSFDHCIVCPSSFCDFCYLQTFLSEFVLLDQNERSCLNYEYVFNNHNFLNYYGHFHTEETYYVIDRDMTQQLHRSPLSQKTKNKTNKNKQASKQKNVFQISSIHIHIFSQLIHFFSGNAYDIFY